MKRNALTTLALVATLGLTTLLVGCQQQETAAAGEATPATTASATAEPAAAVPAGTYAIDPAHSAVQFKIRHMGLSTVTGTFDTVDAEIVAGESLEDLRATATIDAASINTNNADRDDHLRSPDFFNVEQNPELTFVTTEVRPLGGSDFVLVGDLTMNGVTQPVELEAEYIGTATDPWGNEKIGFTAEGQIDRKDFGLTWNKTLDAGGLVLGDEVTMVLDVQAAKQQ